MDGSPTGDHAEANAQHPPAAQDEETSKRTDSSQGNPKQTRYLFRRGCFNRFVTQRLLWQVNHSLRVTLEETF